MVEDNTLCKMKLKGKSLNHRPWNGWYFRVLSMAQNTISFSPLWCFVQSHLWKYMPNLKACCGVIHTVEHTGEDLGGGCRGCALPLKWPAAFQLTLCSLLHSYTKSALSFDMYSQQFTLCYCLVESLLLRIRFLNLFTSPVNYAIP